MSVRSNHTLLLLAAIFAAFVLGGLFWFSGGEGAGPGPQAASGGPGPSALSSPATTELRPAVQPGALSRDAELGPTTVLFPLRVELELVESAELLAVQGGPRLGSGRRARLSGRIADANGVPTAAVVRFVAGPNEGRTFRADRTGAFGAGDLYPGIDVVEVEGPAIQGSRRELRFAEGKETLFHVGYGRPSSVAGRVVNEEGDPVVGAIVRVDGQPGESGENGFFQVGNVAPGPGLLEVRAPGYAPHRQELAVMPNVSLPASSLTVVLARGATLELRLATDVGGPGPATVYLAPALTEFHRRFDWAAVGPISVGPDPLVVQDLPPGPTYLRAFRPGAVAKPTVRQLNLQSGGSERVALEFQVAPRILGRVVADGRVVQGARVRLQAADVPLALTDGTGLSRPHIDDEVRRPMPHAAQEAVTDGAGRFEFTSFESVSPWRLLEVTGPDGRSHARRAVGPGEVELEVELGVSAQGGGALVLSLPARFQGLPVELVVASAPREPLVLAPDENLEVDGLERGRWNLRVTWWGDPVHTEPDLTIDGRVERELTLPPGAVLGQDEETWLRAGETYPLR